MSIKSKSLTSRAESKLESKKPTKCVIGISGASGVGLGLGFVAVLPSEFEVYLVLSKGALECAKHELHLTKSAIIKRIVESRNNIQIYDDSDLGAPISSGSFGTDMMAVIPTSMDTLAKIACGISDTLLTRCANVMIKEHKKLLLATREMPLSCIALENMQKLAHIGVIIAPPILGYYANIQTLQDMEMFLYGKWLDSLDVPNTLYTRWGAESKH